MNRMEDVWRWVDPAGECWRWTGVRSTQGYPVFYANDRQYRAHRVVWEQLVGVIPDGLVLDHLCRVRDCVNPDHLEVVTRGENSRRGYRQAGIYCRRGHSLADAFVYNRKRSCRTCLRDATRRRRAERRYGVTVEDVA